MKRPIHLVIPMSGQGTRYRKAGYTEPKPLIPVNGTPMIERLLGNFSPNWQTTFVMAENHLQTNLPEFLKTIRPKAHQLTVAPNELGPWLALEKSLEVIRDEESVLISYCDYGMVWDSLQFENFVNSSECDACVIVYRGFHPHYLGPTKYAYCRMDGQRVVEVREKGSFTENRELEPASSGAYYFKSAKLLREALSFQKEKNLKVNGEFYTSLTVEALLQSRPKSHVRVFEIPYFFQWGTPEDLKNFEYWEKTFQAWNQFQGVKSKVSQVLMPMAGFGSRFSGIIDLPKPLIPIEGVPMYQQALQSLPKATNAVVVTTDVIEKQLPTLENISVVGLSKTPDGQALTTKEGIASLKEGEPIVISSCDHEIVLNPKVWEEFELARQKDKTFCDAAIFTIKGFPGTLRRPNAFAYVQGGPAVTGVSVKKPFTEHPNLESLLVGTFWFKDKEILLEGINWLLEDKIKVNNEFYLDSVFNCLLERGLKVREIPLEGYINWGDPDSYAEASYWREVFSGKKMAVRPKFSFDPLGVERVYGV